MTREIIEDFRFIVIPYMVNRLKEINYEGQGSSDVKEFMSNFNEICDLAIKALEQEPTTKNCESCRYYGLNHEVCNYCYKCSLWTEKEPKIGHCKDCKYFEYDSVANVDGMPLIVAHEICKRWGNGCKTKEDGYCFMFEPQESEG